MAVYIIDIVPAELRHALLNIGLICGKLCGQGTLNKALDATTHHLAVLRIGVLGQIARAHNIIYRRCEITNGI